MTNIEYLDETWNMIGGCSECSLGCQNCLARGCAAGRLKEHPLYKGLVKKGKWTGEIRLCTDISRNDILEQPLHWRKPRRIFVCLMSDLFHPKVSIGFLTHIFDVIEQCPQHIFLILTKRPENIEKLWTNQSEHKGHSWQYMRKGTILPNVHFGVSISTQKEADEKIPILLQIQAAVRFLSIEPMLGPINLEYIKDYTHPNTFTIYDRIYSLSGEKSILGRVIAGEKIDWVIVGSRPKRRPCKLEWVKSIVEQCKAVNVKIFVKQLSINGKVSHDMNEWPEWARVRQYPKPPSA